MVSSLHFHIPVVLFASLRVVSLKFVLSYNLY